MAWAATANKGSKAATVATGSQDLTTLTAFSLNDRVVVTGGFGSASAVSPTLSCSDSLGNTYTQDIYATQQTNQGGGSWSTNVTVSGTPTFVRLTLSTGTAEISISAQTYTGISTTSCTGAVDKNAGAGGFQGTPSSGATAATTATNELVIGGYSDDGPTIQPTAGTGFTDRTDTGANAFEQAMLEDKDSGATGAQTATEGATMTGANWVMVCCVYKLVASTTDASPAFTRRRSRDPWNPLRQWAALRKLVGSYASLAA